MASLRKRYQEHVEASPRQDGPPVTTAPTEAAKLPPAVDARPPEPITTESPADIAGKDAIRQRLREIENAERITREPVSHPQYASEPPPQLQDPQEPTLEQAIAHLPERVQRWYKAHPEFLTNPEKAAQIQYVHHVAAREVGEQFTDPYFDRMEQMLGLRARPQPSNGNAAPTPPPAPRNVEPPPRQQRSAVPMSAPPSREPASMSTGRPASRRVPLTAEQLEMAKASGITAEEYERQLIRMNQMKAAGALDDRR
jgi:hypothetical protein